MRLMGLKAWLITGGCAAAVGLFAISYQPTPPPFRFLSAERERLYGKASGVDGNVQWSYYEIAEEPEVAFRRLDQEFARGGLDRVLRKPSVTAWRSPNLPYRAMLFRENPMSQVTFLNPGPRCFLVVRQPKPLSIADYFLIGVERLSGR